MTSFWQRNKMSEDKFQITFMYSFLFSPINIGCYYDALKYIPDCDKDLGRFLRDQYEKREERGEIEIVINDAYWGELPFTHISEEIVNVPARLPLYFRFPHLSIQYNLGKANILVYNREQKPIPDYTKEISLSETDIKVNLFIFESGAGIITFNLYNSNGFACESIEKDFENLKKSSEFANFYHTNSLLNSDNLKPFVFKFENNNEYYTLHDIYDRELNFFSQNMKNIAQVFNEIGFDKKFEEIKRNEDYQNLILAEKSDSYLLNLPDDCIEGIEKLSEIRRIDKKVCSPLPQCNLRKHKYFQSPFVMISIDTSNYKEELKEKMINSLGVEMGMIGSSNENLDSYLPARFNYSHLNVGSKGVIVITEVDKIISSQNLNPSILYLSDFHSTISRIFGSIRLVWYSNLVMNSYMSIQINEIYSQYHRIKRKMESFDSSIGEEYIKNLKIKNNEIDSLLESFNRFLLNEDPLIKSVQCSEYWHLFNKISFDYSLEKSRDELWKKSDVLKELQLKLRKDLEFFAYKGNVKEKSKMLKIIFNVFIGVWGLFSIGYLFDPQHIIYSYLKISNNDSNGFFSIVSIVAVIAMFIIQVIYARNK